MTDQTIPLAAPPAPRPNPSVGFDTEKSGGDTINLDRAIGSVILVAFAGLSQFIALYVLFQPATTGMLSSFVNNSMYGIAFTATLIAMAVIVFADICGLRVAKYAALLSAIAYFASGVVVLLMNALTIVDSDSAFVWTSDPGKQRFALTMALFIGAILFAIIWSTSAFGRSKQSD